MRATVVLPVPGLPTKTMCSVEPPALASMPISRRCRSSSSCACRECTNSFTGLRPTMESSFFRVACTASSCSPRWSTKSSSTRAVRPVKESVSLAQTRSVWRLTASSSMALARRTFFSAPSPPPERAMRRRTRASSFSSVRCLLSWNFCSSTMRRRTAATSSAERSENSSFAKSADSSAGFSARSFCSSPRLPASTTQSRCGHSAAERTASSSRESARSASSPRRSERSGSLRPSASLTSRTPPSAALASFLKRASTSPPLQPASRSLRATSTTCPVASTPSFSSSRPRSRTTAPVPAPGPPRRQAKCSARHAPSPPAARRRRWTSMKFRACLRDAFTSRRPTSSSSSLSSSKDATSGGGAATNRLASSSSASGGSRATSSRAW
mmetsp:Transcript_68282/g.212148  ORF Transcript_68282/g.212148 Transcript_68282/m.212148 type:complete len:384 (+) Transcript_68282:1602-2753(+)